MALYILCKVSCMLKILKLKILMACNSEPDVSDVMYPLMTYHFHVCLMLYSLTIILILKGTRPSFVPNILISNSV